MNTKLIFIRHGELDGDNPNVLHGPDDKVSLNEKGVETMKRVSGELKGVDIIFSSNETRTKQSAEIVAKSVSVQIRYLKELQGRIWGDFAGRSWKDAARILDEKTFEERYVFAPPNGESWKQFEERMISALEMITKEFPGKTVCIISHGSSIRVLLPKVFGISVAESLKLYPDYGSVSTVEFDGRRYLNPSFNQTK